MKDIGALISQKEENAENLINAWLPKGINVNEEINKLLTWEYSNKFATTLESKTSVTKIKQTQITTHIGNKILTASNRDLFTSTIPPCQLLLKMTTL